MYQKRRGGRSRGPQKRKIKPNYAPVVVILCLAIGCGYATAKYVVDPVVNYVPELVAEQQKESGKTSPSKENSEETKEPDVVEDEVQVEETGQVSGYALQFGCYSSREAAEKAMSTLDMTGLQILEQNKMYKIVGETYEKKQDARAALAELPETAHAFVTTLYQ